MDSTDLFEVPPINYKLDLWTILLHPLKSMCRPFRFYSRQMSMDGPVIPWESTIGKRDRPLDVDSQYIGNENLTVLRFVD